jgi:hypothetical protein
MRWSTEDIAPMAVKKKPPLQKMRRISRGNWHRFGLVLVSSMMVVFFGAAIASPAQPSASPAESAVAELFDRSCTSCHDNADDLDLTLAPSSLLGRAGATGLPLVVPGQPDASYLMHKLGGNHPIEGDIMPAGDEPLPPEEQEVLRTWIAQLQGPTNAGVTSTSGAMPSAAGATVQNVPPSDVGPTPSAGAATVLASNVARKARPAFNGTHQINLPSTTPLGRNVLEMRVHHRFGQVGPLGNGNYLGLANGATMSLGLAYGIVENLDVLLRFSNASKDWELGAKYVPMRQENDRPLSLAIYASGEWLSVSPKIIDNRWTGNAQLLVSRLWKERLATQLVVTGAFLSNHQKNPQIDKGDGAGPRAAKDKRATLAAGLASTLYLDKKRRYGIDLEYNLPLPIGGKPDLFYYRGGDADPSGSKIGSWALGLSARAGLHLFQVFATNNANIHTNLYAPGADTANPFSPFGSFFLGFNLSRKWSF